MTDMESAEEKEKKEKAKWEPRRLDDKNVKALEAPSKSYKIVYDLPDPKGAGAYVPGFGVRVTANGSKAFVLRYTTKAGADRKEKIGAPPLWSVDAARKAAKELRRRVDSGEDPQGAQKALREAETVRDLAERFEREHLGTKRESTAREYKALINTYILPKLGSMKVAAVQHVDIDRLHRKMSETTPYRANRTAALLSKMFSLAIRWRLRADNPVTGLEKNPEEKRARYLSAAEMPALVAALNEHGDKVAGNIFRILLLTGARRGEVLSATWDQFDLEAGVWVKPSAHTKQKKEHRVPLSGAALELLRQIREEADGSSRYVFPGRGGGPRVDVKKNWAAVLKAAGISGLRMHDLRHSYASMLVNSGLSLPVIGALLGHTQAATTHRYSHLADDPLREATERVGKMVTEAKGRAGKVIKFPSA